MCEDSLEAYIVEGWRTMLVYLERGVYFQKSLILTLRSFGGLYCCMMEECTFVLKKRSIF